MIVTRHRITFEMRKPSLMDRLWFAWVHRRSVPYLVLLAIIFRKATGYYNTDPSGEWRGSVFCTPGYWKRRKGML